MAHDTLIPYSTSSAHNAPNVFRILLAKSFWTHFLLGVFGNAIGRNLVIVNHNSMLSRHFSQATLVVVITLLVLNPCCWSLSLSSSSSFHGTTLQHAIFTPSNPYSASGAGSMTMRKQKASDRRTRRMQRGGGEELALQETIQDNIIKTITSSPMDLAQWKYKKVRNSMPRTVEQHKAHGRGRSRKRQTLYNSLASYHTKFLRLLTVEYQAEVSVVWNLFRHCCWLAMDFFSSTKIPSFSDGTNLIFLDITIHLMTHWVSTMMPILTQCFFALQLFYFIGRRSIRSDKGFH